jgi:hypothetical protein
MSSLCILHFVWGGSRPQFRMSSTGRLDDGEPSRREAARLYRHYSSATLQSRRFRVPPSAHIGAWAELKVQKGGDSKIHSEIFPSVLQTQFAKVQMTSSIPTKRKSRSSKPMPTATRHTTFASTATAARARLPHLVAWRTKSHSVFPLTGAVRCGVESLTRFHPTP